MNLIERYRRILFQAKWKVPAIQWILLSVFASIVFGGLTFVMIAGTRLPISPLMAIVVAFVVLDLGLGYPYLKASQRIGAIEETVPDAFKQISDTLKSGGTFEFALREMAANEIGPLRDEIVEVLRKLEEGQNLENALRGFGNNVDSRLIKRSINIIIDSIESGAGLSDVLEKIADDVRETHRIEKERKATTIMQVLFLVAAGAVVAPFIFGMVSTIIDFLIRSTASGLNLTKAQIDTAVLARNTIVNLMQAYIFVEVIACSGMIAIMREGKAAKSIIYIPILLLVAFVIYYISSIAVGSLLTGTGTSMPIG